MTASDAANVPPLDPARVAREQATARAEAFEDGYDCGHADAHADGAPEDVVCRAKRRAEAAEAKVATVEQAIERRSKLHRRWNGVQEMVVRPESTPGSPTADVVLEVTPDSSGFDHAMGGDEQAEGGE